MNPPISEPYQVGDQIEIQLEDNDIDQQYDGMRGEIADIDTDDLSGLTGQPEDDYMYTVRLETGETPGIHFRRHDLRKIE